MKKIFALFLMVCTFVCSFASCFDESTTPSSQTNPPSASTQTPQPEPEPELTAYEKLNDQEKAFFDVFKGKLSSFNDPSSVKILSFSSSMYENKVFIFKVSAKNGLGGTATEEYIIFAEKWLCPGSSKEIYYPLDEWCYGALKGVILPTDEINKGAFNVATFSYLIFEERTPYIDDTLPAVSKINAALADYIVEQGW